MSSRHSSSPRRKGPETDHPVRRFEPLTGDLINEDMMQYQDRYTTTRIRDAGVTFSIKSDYKPTHIVDHEPESTIFKFGNFRPMKLLHNILKRDAKGIGIG